MNIVGEFGTTSTTLSFASDSFTDSEVSAMVLLDYSGTNLILNKR